MEAEKKHGN